MTREEAIKLLECVAANLIGDLATLGCDDEAARIEHYIEAYDMAIWALRAQQEQDAPQTG